MDDVKYLFKQIVDAIVHLHQKGIAHLDLKLENLLLSVDWLPNGLEKQAIKLIDFGFSREVDGLCKTFCGTPSYMAPEIILRKSYDPRKADAWALGVLLYYFLCGTFPFKG